MVKSLKGKNDSSSATSLTELLTGQSSTPENIPALQYGHEMEEEARQHYLEGLEGYFRDSGFDQNTVQESGKR